MSRLLPDPETDPLAFAPPLIRLQAQAPHPLGRAVLWLLLTLLGALLVWGLVGRLDIVAVADGKLVPRSYVQIVQPPEAGIVQEILVQEGETVRAGQILMRMDAKLTEADAEAVRAELLRNRIGLRRIDAELGEQPFRREADDPSDLAAEIEAQYHANRAALEAALAEERARLAKARQDMAAAEQVKRKLEETLPHYRQQEQAVERLAEQGFAGPLEVSDKRRERIEKEQELRTQVHVWESARAGIDQSEKKLAQILSDYRRQLYSERNGIRGEIERLTQELAKQSHRRNLLELKAPQDGVVKDLATHTAGTVVQPGTVLTTLVPVEDALRAEVWVGNEDIGFVREGLPVKLKVAPFRFQKYGMVHGTVELLSADAAENPMDAGTTANTSTAGDAPQGLYYKALVALESEYLEVEGRRYPLKAGMRTSAEILLGTRTVAEYLLSPVQKAWHEAGRER